MNYYFFALIIMSIISYLLYASDKRNSVKRKWRTRETTLLISSVCLGAVGGLLAMYQFRHKTKHWYFVFVNWVAFIIQITVFFYLLIQ